MSANPIDKNTTPKTTGSLEELFRHHLGEEAAVPTRPMVWDQIDNSLLVRQNESYRRRLVATRWVAAASLLLATLAGTGWWAGRDALLDGSGTVATTSGTAANSRNHAMANPQGSAQRPAGPDAGGPPTASFEPGLVATAPATPGSTATATRLRGGNAERNSSAPRYTGFGKASNSATAQPLATNAPGAASGSQGAGAAAAGSAGFDNPTVSTPNPSSMVSTISGDIAPNGSASTTAPAYGRYAAGATSALATTGLATGSSALATSAAATTEASATQVGLLAMRPAALNLTGAATLPNGLATLPLEETPAAVAVRKWHYGATYAVSSFNPNVNFSRAGIASQYDYNPALGPDSPKLTEAAAAQYREHLRPGISQRIALLATRRLGGRWSLSTGVEFSQASAKSASTASFVGEQLYDLGEFTNGPMRTTDFRYRMASIPVALSYSNPVKKGWSLYGRIGGVVSALLGVRSEVEGAPEATKTYSILSAGMPYRRVMGSVRGGAGAQFRPAGGSWSFTLGPVAEVSAVSLNAHPAQDFLHESRAYGFGVEAGMEFGK